MVSNTGAIINSGTWNAANIFNNIGGTFTTTGIVTATTAFNNAGAFNAAGTLTTPLINNVGAFTVTGILGGEIGHINNAGSLLVDEGGVLIAGGITNNPGGVITNNGAVTDTLDNFGVVINNGTYTADVNNFATAASRTTEFGSATCCRIPARSPTMEPGARRISPTTPAAS